MLESEYQSKVIKKYEALGYYAIKLFKTNKNGIPDLLLLKKDEVIFVEIKGKKTVHAPLQKFMAEELRKLGFTVLLNRSAL